MWIPSKWRGRVSLVPNGGDRARGLALARAIPGIDADAAGVVTGSEHGLRALMRASGMDVAVPVLPERVGNGALPPYQVSGRDFVAERARTGVLNLDDIGLGKTLQTIAGTLAWPTKPCRLVLCPAFLREQWRTELLKWGATLGQKWSIYVMPPAGKARGKAPTPGAHDWVIAYYTDADRAIAACGKRGWFLIVDEIHNVRGLKTARMKAVRAASTFSYGRVGLTASPLYNDGARVYPVLDLIEPGAWGSYYAFAARYASGTQGEFGFQTGELSNADELRFRMAHMSFRRTREEVYAQLPFETVYQTVWLDGMPVSSFGHTIAEGLHKHVLETSLFKVPHVAEHVAADVAAGQPGLIFCYLREHAAAQAAAIPGSLLVNGSDSALTRVERILAYVERERSLGRVPNVVATIDSLSEGANLQWAKVVTIAALDYTPDKLRQAIGRAARMGQTGTVTVRIFAARRSVDEHYIEILSSKLKEQFALDGRKEAGKARLLSAFSAEPPSEDKLKAMYERFMREGVSDVDA